MPKILMNRTNGKAKYRVLLYYKMQPIQDPEVFAQEHRDFCAKHNLLGRILVGKEGLNGTCSGLIADIEAYKDYVHSLSGFEDLWFKEQEIDHHPFPKLQVKYRDEIVVMKAGDVDPDEGAQHISPTQVNELVEKFGDDVVFFDMRSEIEFDVGHFKDAVVPNIRFFREFPEEIKKFEHLKDKKVVMYCTGGIRCEKASPLMKEAGFKDVYQIDGGVYNYCTQYPNGLFDGSCYVFDDRMQIWFDQDGKISEQVSQDRVISHCALCGVKTSRVVNDERVAGRKLMVCCEKCDEKYDISRVRYKNPQKAVEASRVVHDHHQNYVGRGQNYFSKPKVAEIKIEEGYVRNGDKLVVSGPVTGEFVVRVGELRIHNREDSVARAGDVVTIPMDHVVRKSDKVYRVAG